MDIKLEEMTLLNLNEGELENAFQQRLAELANVLSQASEFEQSSDGLITAKIKLEAVFTYSTLNFSISCGVRAELVQPKRRLSVHSAHVVGKRWMVGRDPKQDPLPLFTKETAETNGNGKE